MGARRHGSKGGGGGGYVGGFLHLFDWNAKSRKKLFSSKTESPEQPKQTKRTDGNMPVTRLNTMVEDDMIGGMSLKGSSDYSCATSVTDEDGYGTKAPGVVARLMGLDSLPTFNYMDTYSIPSLDSQSVRDSTQSQREFEFNDCQMEPVARVAKIKPQKMVMEKFQTETLPPKSAKSIPITRHKLLSPIKNSGFVSSSSPAHIMEAASRIPLVGSSSVPSKVKVSKEKIESSRKPKIPEAPRRMLDSNAGKVLKGQQSLEPKKSISLALQAKANVQKREGLNHHHGQSGRTQTNTDRNQQKNYVSSNVLKQNNQKQNSLVDRGKSTPKSSCSTVAAPQTRKPVTQKSATKITENLRTSHKKEPYSVTRRKRSMEDNNNQNNQNVVRDKSYRSNRSDVVSFTFTTPITRPLISPNKNLLDSASNASKSSSLSYNVIGSDALSTLLEQKLRELTCNPASVSQDSLPTTESNVRDDSVYGFSYDPLELRRKHQKPDQCVEVMSECSSNDYEYRKFLRGREPSPNSVLEPSFITESCNSSDTLESCKPNSTSVQGQDLIVSSPMDIDAELLDSATSITLIAKWEPDYVKEVLSDIEAMFADFTIGKTRKIVNPRVFDRLELSRPSQEGAARLRRELVFNCVIECMETSCRVWGRGLAAVRRPERLADDVYKEIAGWEEMKDSMVDELVDKDMSGDGYKRWLDYDVEMLELGVEIGNRLLDSLINEVVDDILVP